MRTIAVVLACLAVATGATASGALDVTVLPKPGFPTRGRDITPHGRLVEVSAKYRPPYLSPAPQPPPGAPAWAPQRFRGETLQLAIRQPSGPVFFVYGRDGSSGRYLLGANPRTRKVRYAFDFVNFWHAPGGGGWLQEVMWAREADGVLFVQNAHLTYANATRELNGYVSAIDLSRKKTLWRSRALVANARTFVLARKNLIVAGYGFTDEPDFLYLLDRRTGRALDRLPLSSAPEIVKLHGDRLHVRTYDSDVVARIVR